ncbi:MAG: hypothetical protein K2L18_12450, partial [Acetatifactor sp.]|nr:hypothetical protein [Acetatifactor sp.]
MSKRMIANSMFILILLLGGCGREGGEEKTFVSEPINYISWLDGTWKIEEEIVPSSLWTFVCEDWAVVDHIGTIYDFTESLYGELSGGVVPIRNRETQVFFHGDGYLSDLELSGNYYTMFWVDTGEMGWLNTCFVIKDEEEWLVWKRGYGVYRLQRIGDAEQQVHAYDEKLTFEDNIKVRMEEQGIRSHGYFSNVWGGNWTIKEVIYTEDMSEAQTHLGETVFYHNSGVDYFDINFIASSEDRVFYRMPTT